jgi:hypothetical protein
VALRYRLPAWGVEDKRAHKAADIAAAAAEAVHVAGWTEAEMRETLGIRAAVLARDPLAARYGGEPWRPWPPAWNGRGWQVFWPQSARGRSSACDIWDTVVAAEPACRAKKL